MIIFLHIPKTAGTTFQFILENSLGVTHCHLGHMGKEVVDQRDLDFTRKFFPWLRSIAGENLVDPLRLSLPDPFYITFLREPVARVFSHYQNDVLRCGKTQTFEEMLSSDEVLANTQVKRLAGRADLGRAKMVLEKFNFVGLTEKFDLSLHVLDKLCPYKLNLNYKRKTIAINNSIKKSLESDSRAVEMTREKNRLDLELYDFAVKEIFPKFCAQAGFSPTDKVASFDKYSSEIKPGFLLHRLYNQTFFRNVYKVYKKRRAREEAQPE
jgi:Sulfotransferase family